MTDAVKDSPSVETWRYQLSSLPGGGWATIFMDSTGSFSALSDWGNVGYRWNTRGLTGGFKRFILECDDRYLLSKLGQGRQEYDPDETLQAVKEYILSNRREWGATKDEAREEWELLETYDYLETDFDFAQWYRQTQLEEASDVYRQRCVVEVQQFVQFVMPTLREVLREELGAYQASL